MFNNSVFITHWKVQKPDNIVLSTGIPMKLSNEWIKDTKKLINKKLTDILNLFPGNIDTIFYWVPTSIYSKNLFIENEAEDNHLYETAIIWATKIWDILWRTIKIEWVSALSLPKLDLVDFLSSKEKELIEKKLWQDAIENRSLYKVAMSILMSKQEFRDIILARLKYLKKDWLVWITNKEILKIISWFDRVDPNSIYYFMEKDINKLN